MWVPELLLPPVNNMIFSPKMAQNMFSLAHKGLTGSFGAPLVGWLVFVVRRLYLARHLFTLFIIQQVVHLMRGEIYNINMLIY